MKKIASILALLLSVSTFSQTAIQKSTLDSGGTIAINGSIKILCTIGEIAIQENTVATTHLSEGFISPDIMSTVGISDYSSISGITIYPNPVMDLLYISSRDSTHYVYHFFDLMGREILLESSDELQNMINVSFLSSGVYVLLIVDHQNRRATSFKIQKI